MHRALATTFITALFCSAAIAGFTPNESTMDDLISAGKKQAPEEVRFERQLLATLKVNFNKAKNATINKNAPDPKEMRERGIYVFHSKEEKDKFVDSFNDTIQDKEKYVKALIDGSEVPCPYIDGLVVGACGRIRVPIHVIQVLAKDRLVGRWGESRCVLVGFDTTDFIDDKDALVGPGIAVTGTTSDSGGYGKCFKIEPLNWDAVNAYHRKKMAK